MSKIKDKLNQIKALFTNESETVLFIDVKLEDGRIFHQISEELTVGELIQEQTGEDEIVLTNIEDGEYVLDNKIKITIKDSIIESIDESDVETETGKETGKETVEDFKKLKVKTNQSFAMVNEIVKWEFEVDQDTFELGTKLTYTYEYDGVVSIYSISNATLELEDGTMVTTDADGIIVNNTSIEETEIEETIDEVVDETNEEFSNQLTEILNQVLDLKNENKELKENFEKLKLQESVNPISGKLDFFENETKSKNKSNLHSKLGF